MRIAFLSLSAVVLAAPAFAADLGTYRPGTPYHATAMPTADVCASTCAGDAQCQGWNYVKPNPQASGVCELQSRVGVPVSSAISISGVSAKASETRRNVVQGDTNTIRVGTAPTSKPKAAPTTTQTTGRRIVRQPVPQAQRAVRPTAHSRPTTQQAMRPQQAQPRIPAHAVQPGRPQAPMQPPRLQPMLDQGRAAPNPMMPMPRGAAPQARINAPQMAPRGPARTRSPRSAAPQGRPPIGQPIPPQMTPQPAMSQPAPMPAAPQSMPQRSAAQPVTFGDAQASLYGSLHDDVRAPASNMAVPADPNMPIPTAQRRPVAPVMQEPLAGARAR